MELDRQYVIRDTEELTSLYNPPLERSVRKQMDHLDEYCRAFIAASPLIVIGTQGAGGEAADNSPRGDVPGFVKVVDDYTLLIPDRRGNDRLDTLRNVVRNPAVGILFLVPGVYETFRVHGEGVISRDPALTQAFVMNGKAPRTVMVVRVREAISIAAGRWCGPIFGIRRSSRVRGRCRRWARSWRPTPAGSWMPEPTTTRLASEFPSLSIDIS